MGLTMPNPPCLTGRASRSLSSVEQDGRPDRAGMRRCLIAVSRGRRRFCMSGIVRLNKVSKTSHLENEALFCKSCNC